jgi:hypothetical protein
MTQTEKKEMLQACIYKLKRAAGFAEAMSAEPVTVGTASTLMQLSSEAHAAVNNLRYLVAGNEPPKIG